MGEAFDDRGCLGAEARAALVRATFEAIAAVGFFQWSKEECGVGVRLTEADRSTYLRHMDDTYWPEFQRMAAHSTDDRLYALLEEWTERADALGLLEWQREQGRGQDGRER